MEKRRHQKEIGMYKILGWIVFQCIKYQENIDLCLPTRSNTDAILKSENSKLQSVVHYYSISIKTNGQAQPLYMCIYDCVSLLNKESTVKGGIR